MAIMCVQRVSYAKLPNPGLLRGKAFQKDAPLDSKPRSMRPGTAEETVLPSSLEVPQLGQLPRALILEIFVTEEP
jgi:hypothetical protein